MALVLMDCVDQFIDFVRSIDSQFATYDDKGKSLSSETTPKFFPSLSLMMTSSAAAWPSLIDDFVEWSRNRNRLGSVSA